SRTRLSEFERHHLTCLSNCSSSCTLTRSFKMKKINKPEKRCKPINTFFLDTKGVLTGICNFGKNRQTHAINLKIIDCKSFKNSNGYPHRKYRAVKGQATSVTVLCNQNRVAYHLDKVVRKRNNG
uniref:Ribonuclease A-domain domain-containing protein n=1 Tax=Xiphophorus maculatus TaxID=8083 RepID=A0A3B5QTK4_XIPMA